MLHALLQHTSVLLPKIAKTLGFGMVFTGQL